MQKAAIESYIINQRQSASSTIQLMSVICKTNCEEENENDESDKESDNTDE